MRIMFNSRMRWGRLRAELSRRSTRLRAKLANKQGIAAVEFALILPLMLTLYLGSVELTKGVLAGRKITFVARALADLASQQLTCDTNTTLAPCLTPTDVTTIFSAAAAILAPYPSSTASLRMTISEVDIIKDTDNKLYAYIAWSATSGVGAIARPCDGGGLKAPSRTRKSLIAESAAMRAANYESKFPPTYTGASGTVGSVIVADVSYDYYPGFGYKMEEWKSSSTKLTMSQIQYMRSRKDGAPITILGTAANIAKCSTT